MQNVSDAPVAQDDRPASDTTEPLIPPESITTTTPESLRGRPIRSARKRMAEVLTELSECACGRQVTDEEVVNREGVVKCKKTGCETQWVSTKLNIWLF